MTRPDRRALGLLTALLLTLTLPFINRAYFVDDYYFVTMAKGILDHPARPYDFISDDAGIGNVAWERGQAPRMVNPPLFHYFLAAVIKVWGDAVWKLRLASLVFPLIALFSAYFLGKRFVKSPLAAAGLLAMTPAFWLTSYSLLIDGALVAFVLASLECFIRGHEKKSTALWVISGVLMGAALLTKYTGFLIIPVVLAWHGFHRASYSWKGTAIALGTCAVLFLLWGLWGIATYGQMHFTATFARGFHPTTAVGLICLALFVLGTFIRWRWPERRPAVFGAWICWGAGAGLALNALLNVGLLATWLQIVYLDKIIGVASFLGGCSVFLLVLPFLLGRASRVLVAAWGLLVIFMYVCFVSRYGGFDPLQAAMLAFFVGSTVSFLMVLGLQVGPRSSQREIFLAAWALMGILELVVVMPWTAARYLLILLPPIVWLFRGWVEKEGLHTLWKTACGLTLLVGGVLAYVDYAQAGTIRALGRTLDTQRPLFESMSPRSSHQWSYLSDTFDGSKPYVYASGWVNVFPDHVFAKDDLFLRPVYRRSSWWTMSNLERFQPVMVWEFTSRIPLRIMDVPASAGFYASVWGILPYAVTPHPLERFELYLVK